jgi:chemosensory pili system protein ChpA (sensor histidine kinase/response regulator)
MSIELDIGPLSWVKGEIDLALERAGESLAAYAADPACDGLTKARASMHQAHGALAIVGLDGITEFADAIKQLLAALGRCHGTGYRCRGRRRPGRIRGAARLPRRPDGRPSRPAAETVFAVPRDGRSRAARPDPGAAALFFPDLTQRPPKREKDPPPLAADALAARLKVQRAWVSSAAC